MQLSDSGEQFYAKSRSPTSASDTVPRADPASAYAVGCKASARRPEVSTSANAISGTVVDRSLPGEVAGRREGLCGEERWRSGEAPKSTE